MSTAQMEKGTWMVGGNGSASFQKDNVNFYFDSRLSPSVGYFPAKNWVIGCDLSGTVVHRNISGIGRSSYAGLGVGAFSRYYIPLSKKLMAFGEIRTAAPLVIRQSAEMVVNRLSVAPGLGLAYFIKDNIAVEATLNHWVTPFGSNGGVTRLNLGFQIYLGREE